MQNKIENSKESHSQQHNDCLHPVYQAEQKEKEFSSKKNIADALFYLVE